jgi:hypothetical protein
MGVMKGMMVMVVRAVLVVMVMMRPRARLAVLVTLLGLAALLVGQRRLSFDATTQLALSERKERTFVHA